MWGSAGERKIMGAGIPDVSMPGLSMPDLRAAAKERIAPPGLAVNLL
jgi:hypothetical protein